MQTAATYFRSLASTSKLSRTSQSIKLEYIAKIYEALLNYIDFPALNLPDVEFIGSENDFDEEEFCYKLTDKAPPEAIKSYDEFYALEEYDLDE